MDTFFMSAHGKKSWIKKARKVAKRIRRIKAHNFRAIDWDTLWEVDGKSGVSPSQSIESSFPAY
jgi:hypothetical protein